MTVPQIALTPNGPDVSRIVPGLMRLREWELKTKELVAWIDACLALGMTTFDHADIYGNYTCEEVFGRALQQNPRLRDQIQIITKCDIMMISEQRPRINIKHYNTSYDHIVQSVENSLRNLHTETIDILLLHRPDVLMDADEVAQAFTDLKQAGKVQHFGVSNHTPSQVELIQSRLDFPLVTNQVEFSVVHLAPLMDGTFDQAQRLRFAPMAWSPLGGGRIFTNDGERARRLRDVLAEVGDELDGIAIDQVMLAWILRHPANVIPVIGTGRPERLQRAAAACAIEMTRTQWYRIWTASTGHVVP